MPLLSMIAIPAGPHISEVTETGTKFSDPVICLGAKRTFAQNEERLPCLNWTFFAPLKLDFKVMFRREGKGAAALLSRQAHDAGTARPRSTGLCGELRDMPAFADVLNDAEIAYFKST